MLSSQGQDVFDDGPHRSEAGLRGHREPELEVNLGQLVERTGDAALPGASAFGGAGALSVLFAHGFSLPLRDPRWV